MLWKFIIELLNTHTWQNSIKTHRKIRGLQFLDMLKCFERLPQFYRPIGLAQVSFREFWISNFTVWRHGIFLRNSWWFFWDLSDTNFISSVFTFLSLGNKRAYCWENLSNTHQLLASVTRCFSHHFTNFLLESQNLTKFKIFLFFLKWTHGHLK